MRVLVTGGAGFIGSSVVRNLVSRTEHSVLVLDKLTYAGDLSTISSSLDNERCQFERQDIVDKPALEKVFRDFKPDKVMHLAAESHVDRSIEDPEAFLKTNIIGTYNLLEVSACHWRKLPHNEKSSFLFHHISTDEVYGDLEPDEGPFTETSLYKPSSPYSASKASSDHFVRAWYRTFGLPTIVTNCSNNYGPFQSVEKLIPVVINKIIKKEPIPVYGDGSQIRDWLYVEDHSEALITVMERGMPGETYNIGGDNESTNLSIVHQICEQIDSRNTTKEPNSSFDTLVKFVEDRPGHDKRYAIDNSKIRRELNWQPRHSFETGLAETINWYLENPEWVAGSLDRISK